LFLNRCAPDENLNLLIEKDGMYYPSIMNSDESGNMAGNAAKKITRPPLPVRFSQIEKAWLKALWIKKRQE